MATAEPVTSADHFGGDSGRDRRDTAARSGHQRSRHHDHQFPRRDSHEHAQNDDPAPDH